MFPSVHTPSDACLSKYSNLKHCNKKHPPTTFFEQQFTGNVTSNLDHRSACAKHSLRTLTLRHFAHIFRR